MNNKIDDVLVSLLQAKHTIMNNQNQFKDDSYNEMSENIDNLITNYTLKNKMTNKEILDTAMSLVDKRQDSKFMSRLKKLRENIKPRNIYKNIKNKITESIKKKEENRQYEEELQEIIKNKLKNYFDNEEKEKTKDNQEINKENKVEMKQNKIPIYNKESANKLMERDVDISFIFKDENKKYNVFKRNGNTKQVIEVNNLKEAVENITGKKNLQNQDIVNIVIDKSQVNIIDSKNVKIDKGVKHGL